MAFWQVVGLVIELVVPGSIDPGEGPMIVLVLGPMAHLGHGDQGLAPNIKMAPLFSAVGVLIPLVWFTMARTWVHWRSSPRTRS